MTSPGSALSAALADRYQIGRELGRGGMATVYLARDLKHDRDVAIKVLHPEMAEAFGAARFLAEIRTTARLQHAHILPLLDSGQAGDGVLYYVMPLITGESLRERLRRETQLPVEEAVRIADEVAGALDYAHRQGVVHRDIKPENILLHEGQAIVADFGIALAAGAAADARLTETGVSLGTPHYMSPEQVAGDRNVSARADIYALGAVLYEMMVGEPPFTGPTQQVVFARAMTQKPTPIRALRDTVPAAVETAVLRALEKVPADRFATAGEFARALHAVGRTRSSRHPSTVRVAVGFGAVLVLAVAAWALSRPRRPTATTTATTRATVPIARGFTLSNGDRQYPLNISADGKTLVYAAERDGVRRLFVRRLADFTESELANTEGATHPVFSADGKWIAYFAQSQLLKIPVRGGTPIVVAPASGLAGGITSAGDSLLFAVSGKLYLNVASTNATIEIPLTDARGPLPDTLGPAQQVGWPRFLPGGRDALVSVRDSVAVLHLASGMLRSLIPGNQAAYLPTGHLVFSAGEGRVRVVPFDLGKLAVTGAAVPVFEAFRGPGGGGTYFAVSSSGTLVYVPGGFDRSLALVDRNGREEPVPFPHRGFRFPRISPDGRRAVVTVDPRPSKTWIVDLRTGALAPVAAPGRPESEHRIHAVWSPDGRQVMYSRGPTLDVANVDGVPNVSPALHNTTPLAIAPTNWLHDGRVIAHLYGGPAIDVVTFRVGDSVVTPLVASDAAEVQGVASPDGRWLAYSSNASGAREVYVRPLFAPGEPIAVSTSGGVEPRWSRDGAELYYRNGQAIMAVSVNTRPPFSAKPQELFSGGFDFLQDDNWDVGPDGRFLMVRSDPNAGTQFLVVLNWFDELRAQFAR
jgi:serine/threonine-protein kinase